MDGIVVIDKPTGLSSHDIVQKTRRVTKQRRVGHAGTLDPLATGVLPLLLGKATKISRYLTGQDKSYDAELCFGITTDTLDSDGRVVEHKDVDFSPDQLEEVLDTFRGHIEQIPPMYSAKKIAGKKLYKLARKGKIVEREAKKIHIYSLELLDFNAPKCRLRVKCSSGTYIRTLADDIGRAIGCGAHLTALRRLEVGSFSLSQALTLEDMETQEGALKGALLSMDDALMSMPAIELSSHLERMVCSGHQLKVEDVQNLSIPAFARDEAILLKSQEGKALAVARSVFACDTLLQEPMEERALKTERVLV
ncbi:MAG: tRNA pseudouridine(55) synthase TruB [Myxococcota bacterium]|jgi:tRNA pseudouridine55 synthase|nr:tRNA pseudouridine(55) synthase TruB [Myxococcota bacterium]